MYLEEANAKSKIFGLSSSLSLWQCFAREVLLKCESLSVFLTGKDRVFGEVERLVTEVSMILCRREIYFTAIV